MFVEHRCVALLVVTLLLPFSLTYPADGATVEFQAAVNYPVGTGPRAVASADFNGDGKADLAVANSGVSNSVLIDDGGFSVLLGNGDGTFQPANSFTAGKNPIAIAASDFNRDGKADLAIIDSTGVGVLLGNGDGTFGPVTYFPTANFPHSLAVSDFDNDNIPDLVVAASSLSVLLGNGDGTFQSHVDYSGSGHSIVVADVNGDGKLDVILSGNGISVLLGNGDGSFQSAIFSSGPIFSVALVAADFDLDGKLDLAVSFNNLLSKSSGTVVMPGNGDGTFQSPPSTDLQSFGVMSAGDFNGDNKADLVIVSGVAANVSGTANVFLGNGNRTFQSALSFAVGTGPYSVLEADFNHDKAPDLAVTNSADNAVSVLLNTTGADFSISASAPTPGTVSRGQSSTSTVTLNHQNTFDNAVEFSCSVQPAQSAPTCSFNPNSVTFDANGGNATATLTISTGAAAALVVPSTHHDSLAFRFGWLPIVGFAFMGVGFGSRPSIKRKLTVCLLGGILLGGLIFQAACGGSSGPGSTTYTITVTGTSGSTQHSTTATLTVQ
jgi:hypothetical protein